MNKYPITSPKPKTGALSAPSPFLLNRGTNFYFLGTNVHTLNPGHLANKTNWLGSLVFIRCPATSDLCSCPFSFAKKTKKAADNKQDIRCSTAKTSSAFSSREFLLETTQKSFTTIIKKNYQTNVSKRDSSFYTDKDKVVSITYEEIGLFPRSFSRVLDRFLKQLFSDVDNLVIQEYRFYRYLFLTTIKTIFILFFVPFVINFTAKNYIVKPITEYFWNTSHPEIFLNSYEQKRAFAELQKFEEKIYFETLVLSHNPPPFLNKPNIQPGQKNTLALAPFEQNNLPNTKIGPLLDTKGGEYNTLVSSNTQSYKSDNIFSSSQGGGIPYKTNGELDGAFVKPNFIRKSKDISKIYQEKTIELATYYNNHSIEAITNFFADLLSLCTLLYLLITLEIQINITKSFLLEVFFGLDDSKKSLLILLITDLLVGYHSSNLWELFFEFIFNHYGIPESQTGIFLLVATLPVLLDVLFKYLIFRHLNRSSPATVATYQAIIE